jgi:hypothetical protein
MQTFRQPSKHALQVEEIVARIAGVLAVYADATEITADRMSNGIAPADWYLDEAVRLEDGASVSADVRKADKLRVWLLNVTQNRPGRGAVRQRRTSLCKDNEAALYAAPS